MPGAPPLNPELRLELTTGAAAPPLPTPFHVWYGPDSSVWATFHRCESSYVVRFGDIADFEIPLTGAVVRGTARSGASLRLVEHLFLNQVTPLVLSRSGELVFHASAVVLDGKCVGFAGATHRGKSTLAASFAMNGCEFLTDDGLLVRKSGGTWNAMPSYPSVRLWLDTIEALGLEPEESAAYPKHRFAAGELLPFRDSPCELLHLYLLGPGAAESPTIRPVSPARAAIELTSNCFLLEVEQPRALAAHFDDIVALAEQRRVFALDYPREFAWLEPTRRAVRDHVARKLLQ